MFILDGALSFLFGDGDEDDDDHGCHRPSDILLRDVGNLLQPHREAENRKYGFDRVWMARGTSEPDGVLIGLPAPMLSGG